MHSSFSFDLETNLYFTPNNFKAYAMALEAPPVPKIKALVLGLTILCAEL